MCAQSWAFITDLDNIILNNYWRKFYTYRELGWDDASIHQYLSEKKKAMQVASFNTRTVSFSASSRRNRFYEIYNQDHMLDQDVAFEGALEGLQRIAQLYKIFIISSRSEELRDKTLEVLTRLGFPLNTFSLHFKKTHENLHLYRKNCFHQIAETYLQGVGICLSPSDREFFINRGYSPIAFTSINNPEDFDGKINIICQSWDHLVQVLNC